LTKTDVSDLARDPVSKRVVTGLAKIRLALKTKSFQEAGAHRPG
jgi:hypothetical protein